LNREQIDKAIKDARWMLDDLKVSPTREQAQALLDAAEALRTENERLEQDIEMIEEERPIDE
jgi:hypothetical protein